MPRGPRERSDSAGAGTGGAAAEGERGLTLLEICLALGLAGLLAAVSLPAALTWLDSARLTAAAGRTSLLFQQLRYRAVARARCCGVVFVSGGGPPPTWRYLVVDDGNGNGIRRAEVEAGIDPLVEGPLALEDLHEGVRFGIPGGAAVPAIPPDSGSLGDPADPIRFGLADIASFTPEGTSSSGTVFLLSPRGRMRAVRLYGSTGRIQVWEYIPRRGAWVRR